MRMHIAKKWASMILIQTSTLLLIGSQYIVPISGQRSSQQHRQQQQVRELGYTGKRASAGIEPTCEELRAMWRYSKRQSRAAESTNELPIYRDPFSYNLWEIYPNRSPFPRYRDEYTEPPRSRMVGGAPIYGKLVLKAPSGSRLRNGMPDRVRAYEELTRLYGTVNRNAPSQRRRVTSFRIAGGSSGDRGLTDDTDNNDDALHSNLQQTGSFQHLKELILTERARELQEQRRVEAIAARTAVLKELISGDQRQLRTQEPQNANFLNSMKRHKDPNNYEFVQAQYMTDISDIGQKFSKAEEFHHCLQAFTI